ncbi:MAG: TVP38/TMEM64 family protein [Halobacteriaceae archaeon]
MDRQLLTGLLIIGIVGFSALFLSPNLSYEILHKFVFSPLFPLILIGLYIIRPFIAWPITILSALVGFRYGIIIGIPIALGGAVVTSLLPYGFGRYFQTDKGIIGNISAGGERFFEQTGELRGVIAARLAPTPAEAISAGAGVSRVSLGMFVLGTAIGELPWTVAAVIVGSSLEYFTFQRVNIKIEFIIATGVLALVLLAKPAYRIYSKGEAKRTGQSSHR